MAGGAEIVGTAAGAAGMIPTLIGRGKNERTATNFGDSKQHDPNAGLWAGRAGAADQYAGRYQGLAAGWQGKAGEYGAQQQSLYNQGQSSMQQQQQARGMQMDAYNLAKARATGQQPLIAQMQGDRAQQQAVAAQSSAAASARGPAAMALAQQTAANNTANAQSSIAGQTQIAAAQEQLGYQQAMAQQAAGMRSGDVGAAQTSYGAGAQVGQLGLGAGQLGATYGQLENDVRKAELQSKAQQQATLAQSYNQAENVNQQTAGANAQNKGLIETIGDFFSDANAKLYMGGPRPMYSDGNTKQFGMVNGPMAGAAAAQGDITHYAMKDGGLDVMGTFEKQNAELDANRSDPTAGMTNGGALGGLAGLLPGRADGGPVQAGQPYVVGERGPEVIIPGQSGNVIPNEQLAPSTWGGGSAPAVQAQNEAVMQANVNANTAMSAYEQAAAEKNPYQRDLDAIQAQRSSSRLLGQEDRLTDDEKRKERVAKAFLHAKPAAGEAEKGDPAEKAKVANGEALPEMTWSKALGEMGKNLNEAQFGGGGPRNPYSDMDTKNYGLESGGLSKLRTTKWVPGGSVDASLPVQLPGNEPYAAYGKEVHQTGEGHGFVRDPAVTAKPSQTTADAGEGASSEREGRAKAKAGSSAKGGARKMTPDELSKWADAELAKVKSQSKAMTEAGPAVRRLSDGTPENGYTTELTEGAEKAYQAWRQKNSPWDTGADYDLRGAFADGLQRDGRLHLPDTYKKPNHETFSVESKYAQHAPDEAGSWDGENYKPKGPPSWLRQEVRGREVAEKALQPSASPMAEAARSMAGAPYAYKDQFRPPEQAPGEMNVGPTAQVMEQSPVAATAIRRDPATGLRSIDRDKLAKVNSAAIADLQQQQDELRLALGGRR